MITGISWSGGQVLEYQLSTRNSQWPGWGRHDPQTDMLKRVSKVWLLFHAALYGQAVQMLQSPSYKFSRQCCLVRERTQVSKWKELWGQDPIIIAPPYNYIIVYEVSLQMLPHIILWPVKWGQAFLSHYPHWQRGLQPLYEAGLPKDRQSKILSQNY